MTVRVFLGLGTNLGDRLKNLQAACLALQPQVTLRQVSSYYETEPWGYTEQPRFLNQVLEGETSLLPLDLLHFLKDLERSQGRSPSFHYGPRLIDMDILFYGEKVVQVPELEIPHPHIQDRAFVLVPLAELAPDFVHPLRKQTVQEMLSKVDTTGVHRFLP